MYGLIGRIIAQPGKRDELLGLLLDGTGEMPGCVSYIISRDPSEPDSIWVTEVWESAESHQASLAIPAVQETISKARPLIAGMADRRELEPVGGTGL